MADKERQETALERSLSTFRLPDDYKVEVLPGRVNIMHTPSGKGIAIQPDHYASVAAALIAFGIVAQQSPVVESDESWKEALPRRHVENERITLDLEEVAIDTRRSDQVLGAASKHPGGRHVTAYAVTVDGEPAGHILALAEKKFVLSVPSLNPNRSVHRGFSAAVQRLAMLVEHPVIRDVA